MKVHWHYLSIKCKAVYSLRRS